MRMQHWQRFLLSVPVAGVRPGGGTVLASGFAGGEEVLSGSRPSEDSSVLTASDVTGRPDTRSAAVPSMTEMSVTVFSLSDFSSSSSMRTTSAFTAPSNPNSCLLSLMSSTSW